MDGQFAEDYKPIVVDDLEILVRMLTIRSGENDAHTDGRFARGIADLAELIASRFGNAGRSQAATQLARYLAVNQRPGLALATLRSALGVAVDVDTVGRGELFDACQSMLMASRELSKQAESLSDPLRTSLCMAILRLSERAECHLEHSPVTMTDLAIARSYAVMHRPLDALTRLDGLLCRQVAAAAF
ncbi:hypothetical protein [Caballeronia sp. LZ016]|uniref:hypothetical protein n=1 Tax=Caballeronia sp. LZ016 TaxID=3038554 RepID=UPI00285DDA5B|nr:hypothetical protein [Caballeronia sp. LZ016]MDR5740176.1 hypothetical protein [Caballeronia sp. LZ016]